MGRRARVNGSSSPSGRGLERFEFWARGSVRSGPALAGQSSLQDHGRQAAGKKLLRGSFGMTAFQAGIRSGNEKQLSTKEGKWR